VRDTSVPPDLQGYSNTLGDFFAWVAQAEGNVVLGTMQREP
jgi:hypothetical protein